MKHIFFDLDRTLWDFEKNSEAALKILFEELELGNHVRSFQSFHTSYKKINAKLWHMYGQGKISKAELRVKRFNDTLKSFQVDDIKLATKLGEGYVAISPHQTNLFPGAKETLKELRNDNFELHIITNGFREVQYIKLEKSGLRDFFDVIVCSEEVGKNKPAPEVFQHALSLAGSEADKSIMIGDDYKVDVLGAERYGMKGVLFDPYNEYKVGTHEWQIDHLEKFPGLIPWIQKSV